MDGASQHLDPRTDSLVVSTPSNLNPRKRKASPSSEDDEMSTSPGISHARLPSQQQQQAARKRIRPNLIGRPLAVDRLLETLDASSLRTVLRTLSDRNPQLRDEILHLSPRPSISSTLEVLRNYLQKLQSAFPLDPNPRSDYSYDRVRPQWQELLDALTDFTPQFLPPNEQQSNTSLQYLDGVTQIIHELPEWDTTQYNLAKQNAYEEISRAWGNVIKEASKRAGGMQLQYGGWEEKLRMHNQKAGGLMQEAYDELAGALGWLRPQSQTGGMRSGNDFARQDIRQQLLSGTYGTEQPVMRTGNW